jgi:hypothetical protein
MQTYLYVKKHSVTGMLYFGKTSKKDPYIYNGSGKYWKNHLQKHGLDNVETLWVSEPFTDTERLVEFATLFSEHFDIVNSNKWANLIVENGIDGWTLGVKRPDSTKKKMSEAVRPPVSEEARKNMSSAQVGHNRKHTIETKKKMSEAVRPPVSEEARKNMSISRTGKIRGPYKKI